MLEGAKSMGAGAAILAAFVAFAGAAWSNHIPDLACLFLFIGVYLSFFFFYLLFHYKEMGNFHYDLRYLTVIILSVLGGTIIPFFIQDPVIAHCDGMEGPPSPPGVQIPEAPLEAPQPAPAPPLPQPVIIPELEPPLISDEVRGDVLYSRYGLLNFGGDDGFRRLSSIISNQVMVERRVEAALVADGFDRLSILDRYRDIRHFLHSPRGRLLSERTYHEYVSQIREQGTRESVPYRRVIQAVRSSHLLLERADGRFP